MLLPSQFNSIIADTFYDKTVSLPGKTTSNVDGWIDENASTGTTTFKANVQFNNLGQVQSDLGLTENVDVQITCATSVTIAVGDLFKYDGITYKASAVIPYDSHLRIAGSKWA